MVHRPPTGRVYLVALRGRGTRGGGNITLHNFLSSQPQLNMHNREVQDAALDVMRFWLDRGVDGFRIDALNFRDA